MRRFVFALAIGSIVGCGKSPPGDTGTPDAPPLTGKQYTVTWGPVPVGPSVESTQCIWVHLGNPAAIKVHQMHDVLSSVSHHLIVYKDDMDTTEQTTPVPCRPFTGALNTSGMVTPLAITQKKDDQITLPDGVAYTLAANQMVKVEMHYINSTDSASDAMGTVNFFEADPATIHDEASLLFTGSVDIDILAGQMLTLHQFFAVPSYLDLSRSHIFAITGHEHQFGTGVDVNVAPSKTGPMTPVYAPTAFSWSEPITINQSPDFAIPVGGGLDFTCTWTNTGTTEVKFGESANNEMCFFWMYYWPSQGSKVCIHTDKYGGANGLSICCPGDSLCSQITGMF